VALLIPSSRSTTSEAEASRKLGIVGGKEFWTSYEVLNRIKPVYYFLEDGYMFYSLWLHMSIFLIINEILAHRGGMGLLPVRDTEEVVAFENSSSSSTRNCINIMTL